MVRTRRTDTPSMREVFNLSAIGALEELDCRLGSVALVVPKEKKDLEIASSAVRSCIVAMVNGQRRSEIARAYQIAFKKRWLGRARFLKEPKGFVPPFGSKAFVELNLARCACRRAQLECWENTDVQDFLKSLASWFYILGLERIKY